MVLFLNLPKPHQNFLEVKLNYSAVHEQQKKLVLVSLLLLFKNSHICTNLLLKSHIDNMPNSSKKSVYGFFNALDLSVFITGHH